MCATLALLVMVSLMIPQPYKLHLITLKFYAYKILA